MRLEIHPTIFREYDIRGIAEKQLSSEFARYLGMAYARLIEGRKPVAGRRNLTVSVGRDCRLTSDAYSNALIAGLTASGIDVVNLGICPTPLSYYSLFHLDLDGGIMITGSHNTADYNGFKICVGRETIHGSKIQEVRKIMEDLSRSDGTEKTAPGDVRNYPIIPKYIEYLVNHAKIRDPKRIVLDAGNGTASTVAPELFKRLGAQVIPLYCDMDGRFPNHHPDPTVPENLKDLVKTVLKEKADLGIAFDGDSDRIGVVDEKGKILFGDEIMVLFSRSILKEKPGATIISEVKSSNRLYQDIAAKGGNPIMWKTGHSLIKSKMKETSAALAGEMSGHIFFADRYFGYDDAIYAGLRVFEILSQSSEPLSSMLSDLPPTYSTPEIRVDCEDEKKFKLVEEVKRSFSNSKFKINDIDGIRVDFGDGWGLVRASNTQPALVLRFEAASQNKLKEIRQIFVDSLVAGAKAIGHAPITVPSEEAA